MGLKEYIVLAFALVARFVVELYDPIMAADLLALIICVYIAAKNPRHPIAIISLLISLSLIYNDILKLMFVVDPVIATIGAIITMIISFANGNSYRTVG